MSSRSSVILTTLLASSLALSAHGAHADGAAPNTAPPAISVKATKTTLANGLELILHEDPRTPIVTVNIWYHTGSKDEPKGRNGFAHLFEHMMFQGSKHVPEDTYFRFLEKAGASSINGTTNDDRTNYFETVPSNQLELALWLESDRMGFLLDHADEATFKSQREVVKNERRQNYENAQYGTVRQYLNAELFPEGHPYHLLTIGSPEDLDAATLEDVRAFFRANYVPNNATLTISGAIEPQKTRALVEKYFGPIPRGPAVTRKKPALVSHRGQTVVEMSAGVELPRVYVAWPTPAMFEKGDAELDLAAHALAGGKSSRLYKRLVYDLQIAQNVSANQQSEELASAFHITATARPGHTATELLKVIDEEMNKLRVAGVTDAELARGKTTVLSQSVFGIERSASRANEFNSYNHYTGDPNFMEQDMARTTSATKETVDATIRTYLKEGDRVVVTVAPDKQSPISGKLLGVKREGGAK